MTRVTIPLTVKEFFELHGIRVEGGYTTVPEDLASTATQIIKEEYAPDKALQSFATEYNDHFRSEYPLPTSINKEARGKVVGTALELLAFTEVKERLSLDLGETIRYAHVLLNPKLKYSPSSRSDLGEIDVACVIDAKLLLIECKSGSIHHELDSILAQVASIRAYGRLETDYCKTVILTPTGQTREFEQDRAITDDLGVEVWAKDVILDGQRNPIISAHLWIRLRDWSWIED